MATSELVNPSDRAEQIKRGLRLEYLTISYNCVEFFTAMFAGLVAGSSVLTGFGLDSVIEASSGLILLWRLHSDKYEDRREWVEKVSLRLVGSSFLLLASYIIYDSIKTLLHRDAPESSLPGILIACLSLTIMPMIVRAKRRVAHNINSGALAADAKQTEICAYLSAILLSGLLLNAIFGWWWADPLAALAMTPIILTEGYRALRGQTCGCKHDH
jgi:divalent metal cation (Fe/Co/Zn/Cd) transporter